MRWVVLTVALAACAKPVVPEAAGSVDPLRAAVDHPDRPAEDRARDADRRPAEVMAFFEVRPGLDVVDLMAGRGWYTELLARAVGPEGSVLAQNNAYVLDRFAAGPLTARLAGPGLAHVTRHDAELDALGLPPASVDVAVMVLFYHDTVWQQVDRDAMNAAVFAALRPGGVFGVVDHHAAEGAGLSVVETLHRIERARVVEEVTRAGFVLEAESDVLRHPEDDRSRNVFDEGLRGRTDRFVLRFRKPS